MREPALAPERSASASVPLLAALLLGVAFGQAIVAGWLPYAFAFLVAVAWLAVVVDRPQVGVITLLLLTSSVLSFTSLPAINVGVNLRPMDLILGLLLLLAVLRPVVNASFRMVRTPLDLPVMLFAISAIVSWVTAVRLGVDPLLAIPEARYPLFYLTFFVVTNLVSDKKRLRWLLRGMFVLATLTALGTILPALVGSSMGSLAGIADLHIYEVNVASQEFEGIARVEAAGSVLIQCMLVAAFAALISRRAAPRSLVYAVAVALMLAAVVLSFYRTLWIASAVSLGLVFFMAARPVKARILLAVLVVVPIMVISGIALASSDGRLGTYANALITRTTSLITGDVFVDESDTWITRTQELRLAAEPVMAHPVTGVGFANPWRPGDRFRGDTGVFTHNGYLWVLVKMGLLGLIPFLLMISVFVLRGLWLWRRVPDSYYRAIVLGFALAFIGLTLANVGEARLIANWKWTAVLGVVMGINEVIYRLGGAEREAPPDRGARLD